MQTAYCSTEILEDLRFIQDDDDKLTLRIHKFGTDSFNLTYPKNNVDTPLYSFIEDDIDTGIYDTLYIDPETGGKINGVQPKIEKMQNAIYGKILGRVDDESFWTDVLGVDGTLSLSDKILRQDNDRTFYYKGYTDKKTRKIEIVTRHFGLQDDFEMNTVKIAKYYHDKERISNAYANAVVNSGFIAGYSKFAIQKWKDNGNGFRDVFPNAFVFTLERRTFYDFEPIMRTHYSQTHRKIIPFKIPLIHASVYTNGTVLLLNGLWKSLYGQIRYYVADKQIPKKLSLSIIRELIVYLKSHGFPDLRILSMNALTGTQNVFRAAGIQIHSTNVHGVYNIHELHQFLRNNPTLSNEPHYVLIDDDFMSKIDQYYRSNPLDIACKLCLEPATHICTECKQELCDECSIKSEYC